MRARLSYANVTATIALVAALGTGGAYAANSISGKELKPRSVPGKKLIRNSVTGKEVRESRLAKVRRARNADRLGGQAASAFLGAGAKAADADKLDGIDAGAFVQGAASVSYGRELMPLGGAVRQFDAGFGRFELECQGGVAGTDVRFFNTSGAAVDMWRTWIVGDNTLGTNGAADSQVESLASGGNSGLAFPLQYVDLRAGQGARFAELRVHASHDGANCRFEWELLLPR